MFEVHFAVIDIGSQKYGIADCYAVASRPRMFYSSINYTKR